VPLSDQRSPIAILEELVGSPFIETLRILGLLRYPGSALKPILEPSIVLETAILLSPIEVKIVLGLPPWMLSGNSHKSN